MGGSCMNALMQLDLCMQRQLHDGAAAAARCTQPEFCARGSACSEGRHCSNHIQNMGASRERAVQLQHFATRNLLLPRPAFWNRANRTFQSIILYAAVSFTCRHTCWPTFECWICVCILNWKNASGSGWRASIAKLSTFTLLSLYLYLCLCLCFELEVDAAQPSRPIGHFLSAAASPSDTFAQAPRPPPPVHKLSNAKCGKERRLHFVGCTLERRYPTMHIG